MEKKSLQAATILEVTSAILIGCLISSVAYCTDKSSQELLDQIERSQAVLRKNISSGMGPATGQAMDAYVKQAAFAEALRKDAEREAAAAKPADGKK